MFGGLQSFKTSYYTFLQLEQIIINKMFTNQAVATPVSLAFVDVTQGIISRKETKNTIIYEHHKVLKVVAQNTAKPHSCFLTTITLKVYVVRKIFIAFYSC
jgi:hypothetical protein